MYSLVQADAPEKVCAADTQRNKTGTAQDKE